MILNAACACDVGKIRSQNEDNFYFFGTILQEQNLGLETVITKECVSEDNLFFGVFDGMGGHACGEKAARISAETIADFSENYGEDFFPEMLVELITQMNDRVFKEVEKLNTDMGSTAVIVRFFGEKAYFCNVGDSKAFLFRNNTLVQKSKDHTDKEFLMEMGLENCTPRLVQYIGMDSEEISVSPHIDEIICAVKDQILLCSDGLTDMISEERLSEILSLECTVTEKVQRLVSEAMDNGGKDNTTVMLIEIAEICGSDNKKIGLKALSGVIKRFERFLLNRLKH